MLILPKIAGSNISQFTVQDTFLELLITSLITWCKHAGYQKGHTSFTLPLFSSH